MLPNLSLLAQIQQKIQNLENKQGEFKQKIHYCCYLLCEKAGLRVSEAVSFNLNAKTKKGLYRLSKTKGKKERYVYIPKQVISELKKHHWKPNDTNRFNFYHFLRKIKRELSISQNIELTPHTLRRAFATYHAESGLPLPLLQKLLGHSSIRTTALYWMNIYNDGNDTDDILTAKFWPANPRWKLKPESEASVNLNLDELPELVETPPQPLASEFQSNYLSEIHQLKNQLSQIRQENNHLKKKNANLQNDLSELSQRKSHETKQREQIQQELTAAQEIIQKLEQNLANEQKKHLTSKSNLVQEKETSAEQKRINNNLLQQLQTEQETNTNLTKKLHAYEQNHTNLINAYQSAIKDKQKAEQQANYYKQQLKSIVQTLHQWQKLHYYQQLEKNQLQAQIIQPPPWSLKKD